MTTELTTINIGTVPAHVSSLFAQLAGINNEATDGIGAGMYPLIKASGTRFVLVKDGEEKTLKTTEIRVIVLRAKAGFEKRYYTGKFDPNATEANAPDCWSSDGVRPVAGCKNQQNTSCAGCKQNEFGTGTAADGSMAKGKACTDRKLLAVLYPNADTKQLEVYGLSIPPASLKSWGAYVRTLSANNVPLPAAYTTIGFDDKFSFPVFSFEFGGVMGEKELAKVVPMLESKEVLDIVQAQVPSISNVPPAQAKAVEHHEEEKKVEKKIKSKVELVKAEVVEEKEEAVEVTTDEPQDAELAAMLGLNL